ncbi:MAG: cupin domain-containing protein, partial [Pseudomonadota bacterium]
MERIDGAAVDRPRPQGPERPLVAFARDLGDGHVVAMHRHDHGQLVYCATGTMRISTNTGLWIVPAQRAVWIPAGEGHEVTCIGAVAMRAVYVFQE